MGNLSKNNFKGYFIILLAAFALRFGLSFLRTDFIAIDEKEYFYNGANLQVIYNPSSEGRQYDYRHWFNRTPVYMLFRYITQGNTLLIQMILSSIGVLMIYSINKKAGWVWCFYLPDVFYSFHYFKQSLMIFTIILGVWLWKNGKKLWQHYSFGL